MGIGGKKMEAQGLRTVVPIEEMSVVGFWEVAKKYSFFKKILNRCRHLIENEDIYAFIPVDYPGFNVRLAKYAHNAKVPVIYYIAPQLWAWGRNRARKLQGCVDLLLVVFPFETEYFNAFGLNTKFIGHPLLDDPLLKDTAFGKRKNQIALLPGSRVQEITKHLPILEKTSDILRTSLPDFKFVIAASEAVGPDFFVENLREPDKFEIREDSLKLMTESTAGIVKTGTSTLEAALCGMPFLMYYKASPLTYFIGRNLINLDHISLANILLKRQVVNELIQNQVRPEILASETINLIKDESLRKTQSESFKEIRQLLGKEGASNNAANEIRNFLDK